MAYSLSTHYAGQWLLDSFSFFTGEELNGGFVDYQDREAAMANDLVSIDEFNRVKLGVDSINTYSTSDKGRSSVRITSNAIFTHGLFIADFSHMPSSTCGVWPSFWAFNNEGNGSLWPTGGEIDIIEGANTAQRNLFSAHTTPGCQAPEEGFTGAQGPVNCSLSPGNDGCNYAAPTFDSTTYGDAFNAEGGGVYALEWSPQDIKIWHFPRTAIPDDIYLAPEATPDPTTWGPPQALFGGSKCETDAHFFNMSLAINTNFCGEYAGKIWGVTDQCNELAPTCEEYVARNLSSFNNAFWQINYIDVYQKTVPTNGTLSPPFSKNATVSKPAFSSTASTSVNTIPRRTRTTTVKTTATQVVSTPEPTRTGSGRADTATINGWALLGCFGSLGGYTSFSHMVSSGTIDKKTCIAGCVGRKYAGVAGKTCYCADMLIDTTAVSNHMCNLQCPGRRHESCGGVISASERASLLSFADMGMAQKKSTSLRNATLPDSSTSSSSLNLLPRGAASTVLLTVYGRIDDDVPPGAPAKGGRPSGEDPGQGAAVTSAVTVTFTTISPTDRGKLMTVEYCTTLTMRRPCGMCTVAPALPMTTYTATCDACGVNRESTVTLTVPQAVAAGTGGGSVVAIAVQTVIPLGYNVSPANVSATSPSITANVPSVGAGTATVSRMAGFLRTLGYGLALWFTIFWVGVLL